MGFEFTENVTLTLPDIKSQFAPFTESHDYRQSHKLITEIAAIHAGLTSNFNMYTADALEASLQSWVTPYARPIIMNHDEFSEPVGRVMAARMEQEADGTRYVRLQAAIMDPTAIEKVMDERYLTGSVGGSAESAKCSVCNVDWAKENLDKGMPCRHRRGNVYEGKLAYFELGELSFREYSFVNVPADKNSGVRDKTQQALTDADASTWTHVVKMYSLDMNKPSIVEMSESAGSSDILQRMKKREAQATYMNVKGTFLTVSALDYVEKDDDSLNFIDSSNTIYNELDPGMDKETSSQNDEESIKENDMSGTQANEAVENAETQEDDVLSVSEQLSADLAAPVTESDEEVADGPSEEEEETVEEEETTESPESSGTETEIVDAPDAVEPEDEDEEVEQQLDDAVDGTSDETAEGEVEPAEKTTASDSEESGKVEGSEKPQDELPPSRESEDVLAENERLKTENGRLRTALHGMLVERVVEAKIARGIEEASKRADLVEEHSKRTAASLADSLRDLGRHPVIVSPKVSEMEITSMAVGNEANVEEEAIEEAKQEVVVPWQKTAEQVLTERLMGRVKF